MDIYKYLNINIGTVMKNPEILKFVPDCQNQGICKYNYPNLLECVPECYETQEICGKTVITYSFTIKFVPECFVANEICDKAVNRCFFEFDSIANQYKI